MSERKLDADMHYRQAIAALAKAHPPREVKLPAALEAEATHWLMLAQVSAIREQTEAQRQRAPLYVDFEWCNTGEAGLRGGEGWHFLGVSMDVDTARVILMGRPRNVPKDAEGGGEPL